MNYTYARGRFRTRLEPGDVAAGVERDPDRAMLVKKSMMGAGTRVDRDHKTAPRRWNHERDGYVWSDIDEARYTRRQRRNAIAKGDQGLGVPLFTAALQRVTPRGLARGLAETIRRYSAALVFSKSMRIRAGKR